ncbi:MAG TPA: hypothetical protein VLA52_03090, partial [Thermohalobaculum sp.]|nr:hypothetical protein [Thermohalobaculum sp.]
MQYAEAEPDIADVTDAEMLLKMSAFFARGFARLNLACPSSCGVWHELRELSEVLSHGCEVELV